MKIRAFLWAIAGLAFSLSAHAATSISTGVAPWLVNGNPVVVENPASIPTFPGGWISAFGDGQWVGVRDRSGAYAGPGDGEVGGTYTFTVNLGAYMGGAGTFSLDYATDDSISWSITGGGLGGAVVCTVDCWSSASGAPRTLTGSYDATSILTGTAVNNVGVGANPMGLLVVGMANPVPEPAEWAMMLGGLACVGLIARRRRKA